MEKKRTTLLVRHLPESLPQETLKRLFARYGASDIRTCIGGRLKNCAFVDFEDEVLAARAQSQLHRLHFLGKTLVVEKARSLAPDEDAKRRQTEEALALASRIKSSGATPSDGSLQAAPIAASLGVDYPFPPHLEYAYPPPDKNILSNISNTLIAVPKFYTQVLHLMNKMNLPPPFRAALPAPPLPAASRAADLASDESELESSADEGFDEKRIRKKRRMEPILGPAVAKDASHEAAGVKTVVTPSTAVPTIKKKQPVIQIKIAPKAEPKPSENAEEGKSLETLDQPRSTATTDELQNGKLPFAEIANHPALKNYTPGHPTPMLYIKNLEKDVVPEDLFHVFGAFFSSLEETQASISVKLMQEGRMKGQAFVKFPSTELAGTALAGAHLFVLKGKPMVIQFGRKAS